MKNLVFGILTLVIAVAALTQLGWLIFILGPKSPEWVSLNYVAAQTLLLPILICTFLHAISELD